MDIRLFVATKAFINLDGKVLILRESSIYEDGTNANKYDVVGGRLEPGEKFDESLLREVKEETGLIVSIEKPFFVSEWRPIVRGEQWQVVGIFFKCSIVSGNVELSQDHDDYQWMDPKEFEKYDLIENLKTPFERYLVS